MGTQNHWGNSAYYFWKKKKQHLTESKGNRSQSHHYEPIHEYHRSNYFQLQQCSSCNLNEDSLLCKGMIFPLLSSAHIQQLLITRDTKQGWRKNNQQNYPICIWKVYCKFIDTEHSSVQQGLCDLSTHQQLQLRISGELTVNIHRGHNSPTCSTPFLIVSGMFPKATSFQHSPHTPLFIVPKKEAKI